MAKFNSIVNSFAKGMLSKKMRGRTDSKDYFEGAELIQNFLGYKQGGVYRRPGTQYIEDITSDNITGPLIPVSRKDGTGFQPFLVSTGSAAALLYEDGSLDTGGALGSLLLGDEFDGTTIELGTVLDYITIGEITFITRNNLEPLVAYWSSGISGAVATTKFRVHMACLGINRDSIINPNPAFAYLEPKSLLYHAYDLPNIITSKTITPSALTGAITITANFKIKKGIGAYVKITHGAVTGVAQLTGNDSTPTSTNGTYTARTLIDFGATTASNNFNLSVTHKMRYLTTYQQRVVYGVNERLFGSRVGNLQHLMVQKLAQDSTTDASGLNYFGDVSPLDPYDFYMPSKEISEISWLDSGEYLEIGTDKNESTGFGGNGEVLSSLNVNITNSTAFGSKATRPVRTNKSTISISRDGYYLREFIRSQNTTTQNTRQLNLISEEIQGDNTFVDLALQKSPGIIWIKTSDNELLSCVYHEEVDVISWATHAIGGTDVLIKEIEVIDDVLWMIVERTVNSSTVEYFEKLEVEYKGAALYPIGQADSKPFMMDSCFYRDEVWSGSGTPVNTVSGLGHLEGETVDAWVDGVLEEGLTVSSGSITTTASGTEFFVGLPYTSKIITMPVEAGGAFGTAQGSIKRIHEVFAKFYRTINGKLGDPSKTYPIDLSNGVTLVTDDIEKKVDLSPGKNNQVVIEQDKSLPMSVLAVVYKGVTYDQ